MTEIVRLAGVSVLGTGGEPLLDDLTLTIRAGEHWAILGANGAGKTTLLRIVRGELTPDAGAVRIAGEAHGAPGLRDPRMRIGALDGGPRTYAATLTGLQITTLRPPGPVAVIGAAIPEADLEHARMLLALLGAEHLADRRYASCSQGERQRILLARALMRDPAVLVLDEPVAALDLPSRELLLRGLEDLARRRPELATLTVTHHLEELPASTTHVALLRAGTCTAQGPAAEILVDRLLSDCYGIPVAVDRRGGRWSASLAA